MYLIHHRRNTSDLLSQTPKHWGVEVDIRSYGDKLVVHHDPFTVGIELEEWLECYDHRFIILNTKEEGLEQRLLTLMDEYDINDFFFLDQSFPFLLKTALSGESRSAVRFSQYESIETVLSLSGLVNWVWVDYFTSFPLDNSNYNLLTSAGFQICLVSPELQGHPIKTITELQQTLIERKINVDAVCSKFPELWQSSTLDH